ncbi:hypothetical protein JTB14_025118 [Gonioctena quinquepunctata]|nr:hypothetical protein JTB14_025118 [Gonioctena quinquepunctata]
MKHFRKYLCGKITIPVQELSALAQSQFIISLFSAEKLLGYSVPLAKILQLENSDLAFAMDKAEETISTIKYVRENAEAQFKNIFDEAKQIADEFDIEIKIPRLASKQTNRANVSKISFHTMG